MSPDKQRALFHNFAQNFLNIGEPGLKEGLTDPNEYWLGAITEFNLLYWAHKSNTSEKTLDYFEQCLAPAIIEGAIAENEHEYFYNFSKILSIADELPVPEREATLYILNRMLGAFVDTNCD